MLLQQRYIPLKMLFDVGQREVLLLFTLVTNHGEHSIFLKVNTYLVPFTVFDSFSHPFLPCQCSFTFCVVWHINLRTVNATYSKKTRLSLNNFKGVQNNKVYKLMIYSTIIKSFTFYGV
jgi:hypothetical protein